MKFQYLLFTFLFLIGCKSKVFNGSLEVTQDVTFNHSQGQSLQIIVGNYPSKLSIEGKKKLLLSLNVDGDEQKIEIKTADEIKNYMQGDDIVIPASETNQNYDVVGTITSQITVGQLERDYERCTYREPYSVCHTDPRGYTRCSTQYRTQWGYQDVEFRVRTTTTNMSVGMTAPNDAHDSYTNFKGHNILKERLYQYQGFCR